MAILKTINNLRIKRSVYYRIPQHYDVLAPNGRILEQFTDDKEETGYEKAVAFCRRTFDFRKT